MNKCLACAVVAFSLLSVPPANASSNSEAMPPGIPEAKNAFHYAESAYEADDIILARTNLQRAINCLVGQADNQFSAVSGGPCADQGHGAVQDVRDASIAQQLRLALAEMSLGLKKSRLTTVRAHALAAMDYMQPERQEKVSTIVANASPVPSARSGQPFAELNVGEVLSSQLKGAAVTGIGGGPIGTITDLLLDAQSQKVSLVGLAGDDRTIHALGWRQLGLSHAAAPRSGYVSTLSASDLGSAPRFVDEVHARPSYIDVDGNLIGRTVLVADGRAVGKATDLIIDVHSGRVSSILMTSAGAGPGASQFQIALRWADIANLFSQRDIVLTLDESQFASAPRFLSR